MHQGIYERLQAVARSGATVTYGELAPLVNLNLASPADRNELAALLGAISWYEYAAGHPLLSVVVVHSDTLQPGKGFFTLARELEAYTGSDDLASFIGELRRVHACWGAGGSMHN